MSKSEFWEEDFIFMRNSATPSATQISFCSYLDSYWRTGAKVGPGGGEYAVHYIVLSGTCEVQFGQERVISQPGSFTVRNHAYDSARVSGNVPLRRKVFMLHQNPLLTLLLREMFSSVEFTMPLRDTARVEAWFDAIKAEMNSEQSPEKLAGLYFSLLHELHSQRTADPRPELLHAILCHIDCNIGDSALTRQSIADNFSISVRTLCRLFEQHLQTTPANYIASLRLEQVKRMLSIPTLSIKTIAAQTGFGSSNYLCRTFRKHFGMSPEKYRF